MTISWIVLVMCIYIHSYSSLLQEKRGKVGVVISKLRHHDGFDLAESLCAHSESLGKRMHAFLFTMEYSCHISREHFFETLGRSIPGQWNRIRVLCASVQEGAGMETGLSSSRNAKDSISLVYDCARPRSLSRISGTDP